MIKKVRYMEALFSSQPKYKDKYRNNSILNAITIVARQPDKLINKL